MDSPIAIFKENWREAQRSNDSNASYCILATVAKTGQVSTRTLVLREVTQESFIIFFDSTSPKWEQLAATGQFELLVFWPSLMQQYRVRGKLSEIDSKTMRNYWITKPYNSKLLDHYRTQYEAQSSPISARATLISGIEALKKQFPKEKDIPFPQNAKGISIIVNYMEIWLGSESDLLHQRNRYTLSNGQWGCETLVP